VRSSFSDKWFGEACFPLNQMTTGGNSRSAGPGMLFTSRWFEEGFHSWLKSGLGVVRRHFHPGLEKKI